jgi:hypothetical protein
MGFSQRIELPHILQRMDCGEALGDLRCLVRLERPNVMPSDVRRERLEFRQRLLQPALAEVPNSQVVGSENLFCSDGLGNGDERHFGWVAPDRFAGRFDAALYGLEAFGKTHWRRF